ncbi:hypothetical protein [Paenibacillus sp. YN15]|uniref:hypothetical protein n=1 Tax=Paenibacillus sp. YN15 TaxID=1742774 RepID=UPI000DCE96AA|nr:hypothetical protein [Paenibacillus sp. YN15]RAU96542.1 hypothetical protein DQG13_20345 [Paenibacillus sp. YN15]
MKVVIMEKTEAGELVALDARDWNDQMIAMMNHANYLLVNGKEYEMVEGRLNVNEPYMEVLVLAVKQEASEAAKA